MISLLSALLLVSPAFAAGGQEVGNGGNAVVCRDEGGAITSAELLDFYEARTLRGIQRDLGPPGLSVDEKFGIVLKRLGRLSPERVSLYTLAHGGFPRESRFLPGVKLTTVPDSFHVAIPDGCQVEQLAIQKQPEFPEDRRYTINQDLWQKLDNDSRTGLILHEIIYGEALGYGATDSVGTRYLNSKLCSPEADTLSLQDFIDVLVDAGFGQTDVGPWEVKTINDRRPEVYADGTLEYAELARGGDYIDPDTGRRYGVDGTIGFYPNGRPSFLHLRFYDDYRGYRIAPVKGLDLYEDGSIQEATFAGDQAFHAASVNFDFDAPAVTGDDFKKSDYVVRFFRGGGLASCGRCSGWALLPDGEKVRVSGPELRADGRLQQGTLLESTRFRFRGKWVRLRRGSLLGTYETETDFTPRHRLTLEVGGGRVTFAAGKEVVVEHDAVRAGTLARATRLQYAPTGEWHQYPAGELIVFNPDGKTESDPVGTEGN
jgi:hypothetical protein